MKKGDLFKRILGVTLSAMLVSSVMTPNILLARANNNVGVEQVTGSVPKVETKEIPTATGKVYHVDSKASDENGDGSIDRPFKTLAQVNEIVLQPGDGISLKCGSIFDNQKLHPKGKGTEQKPIVINTYGEGDRPIINAGGFKRTGEKNPDGTPAYSGHKEAVLIENMEYVYVTGLEVTNDDAFNQTSAANDPNNAKDGSDDVFPRRLGIHVTIDERATDTYKTKTDENDNSYREYKGIVIDNCYVHDVDGNENRGVNKVDGGIGVEVIFSSKKRVFPYFNGVTIQNNRIDQCDRTGIKAIRISDLDNFRNNNPDSPNYDPNNDADNNGANDNSRYTNIRQNDQAQRGLRIVNNYLSDIGGDGILVCESKGAIVEHNIVNGQALRAGGANAGIWSWNSFDTLFRYNESFRGPDYNQDGCSYDSDYYSAGTIFEYNYSHDTKMGFMLLMGGNDTDIIRYNLSQNDGLAWRHGAGGANSPSYIYNNVFYYDGANWVFNHSNGNGVALNNNRNWAMYNNIFYNYNPDTTSKWGTRDNGEGTRPEHWSNTKVGGNLVYEASGNHSIGEIPNAIHADPKFIEPGGAKQATIPTSENQDKQLGVTWNSNWDSLKSYGLQDDSPAINAGVFVDVIPQATGENIGKWDSEKDRNIYKDFFGNSLTNSIPDIGIIENQNTQQKSYDIEENATYKLRDVANRKYITVNENNLSMTNDGTDFVFENVGDGFKIRKWDTDSNRYMYLSENNGNVSLVQNSDTVWKTEDLKTGLHKLKLGNKYLNANAQGQLSLDTQGCSWYLQKEAQSKSFNVGGEKIDSFSADRKYDENKKISGYVTEGLKKLTKQSNENVFKTGVVGESIEYKLYAQNSAHNLKLYVSEMENVKGRTFDILINGQIAKERYTLSKAEEIIELAGIYPVNGIITIKLQHAYSSVANANTNPILNGIVADTTPMAPVNMRIDAGNTDTSNLGNHDGLYPDAEYTDKTGSGYYENNNKATQQVNSQLSGNKPNPDAGMGTALKSGRAGEDFGYKFKVSPGDYRIKLYFNDTSSDNFNPGNFDILVNGKVVKENFNIETQAGGKDKATDLTFTAQPVNSIIDISFKGKNSQKALVNAVIVEPYKILNGENLATNKTVTASAKENNNTLEKYAVDGNNSTRWCSGNSNGEHWLSVDLEKNYMIDKVMIDWTPGAYATTYRIETSTNGSEFKSVKRVEQVHPGLNIVEIDTTEARYVRVVSEKYNDQWGMSMTEFGVYGEEITGTPATTTQVTVKQDNKYNLAIGLEHIYNKYRNVTVSMTYDEKSVSFDKSKTVINENDLLITGEPTEKENQDGTKTISYALGIKNQDAFKKANNVLNGEFTAIKTDTRNPIKVDVSFSSAEGHITNLEQVVAYVPNSVSYADLRALLRNAQNIWSDAKVGTLPGEYTQSALDTFKAVIDEIAGIKENQEDSVYEQAYNKLEKAIKDFKDSVNKNKYSTYHADYSVDTKVNYTYNNASGKIQDGALLLDLKQNGTALDNDALPLQSGVLYVKFSTDSIEDQTLFRIGNIRVGYDKGGNNWFYDSAKDGYGNFKVGNAPVVNKIHELEIHFTANDNNTYNLALWFDGEKLGELNNRQYDVTNAKFQFETRRAAHKLKVYEVYFTNAPKHIITVNEPQNGTVNHFGNTVFYEESQKTFVFTPNEGYEVEKVMFNGEKVPVTDNRYTVDNVPSQQRENANLEVTFRQQQTPVNKDSLKAEISAYEQEQEEKYTFDTWNEYKKAYENALIVMNDSTATQQEVMDAVQKMITAKEKLQEEIVTPPTVNKDALKALIDSVNALNKDEYTKESFDNLMAVKAQAQAIIDNVNATQTEVDDMLTKLQKAINDLVTVTNPPVVDKTKLKALVDSVNALNKDEYTKESFDNLMAVKAQAQAVIDNVNATQTEIDDILIKLQKAIDSLQKVNDNTKPGVDKSVLKSLLDKVDKVNKNNYTKESYDNLMIAKEKALAVMNNQNATEQEVKSAIDMLQKALDSLQKIKSDSPIAQTGDNLHFAVLAFMLALSSVTVLLTIKRRVK